MDKNAVFLSRSAKEFIGYLFLICLMIVSSNCFLEISKFGRFS